MNIIRIPVSSYVTNCYIVSDSSKEAIIIDPGFSAVKILEIIEEEGLDLKYIVLTHGHGDHIGAVEEIREKLEVPVIAHRLEKDLLLDPAINLSNIMEMGPISLEVDILVEDGDLLEFGNLKAKYLHTPGHTRGCMCIDFGELVFTGDTIFKASIGRTDFPGGSHEDIINSIKNKILVLDDKTVLLSGHGEQTEVGYEKLYNPFIK